MKSFPFVVDQLVSEFLCTTSFVALRSICIVHYRDQVSWSLRSSSLPVKVATLNMRERLALNYLLSWATQFKEEAGSALWYKRVVGWLEYNASIRIMHRFFMNQINQHLNNIDLSELSQRRKFLWQRLWHRHPRLYKRNRLSPDEPPAKRRKCDGWFQNNRVAQLCC